MLLNFKLTLAVSAENKCAMSINAYLTHRWSRQYLKVGAWLPTSKNMALFSGTRVRIRRRIKYLIYDVVMLLKNHDNSTRSE